MARRKSDILKAIKRARWELKDNFLVCYVHRMEAGERVKCVSGSMIEYVDPWAIHLVDDTSIPYHRIVEIKLPDGAVLWSRKGGKWVSER